MRCHWLSEYTQRYFEIQVDVEMRRGDNYIEPFNNWTKLSVKTKGNEHVKPLCVTKRVKREYLWWNTEPHTATQCTLHTWNKIDSIIDSRSILWLAVSSTKGNQKLSVRMILKISAVLCFTFGCALNTNPWANMMHTCTWSVLVSIFPFEPSLSCSLSVSHIHPSPPSSLWWRMFVS